jgi:nucleoside-diphosphate-sugar epimerase
MPRYDRWAEEFPPIGDAVLAATRAANAALITVSNVYSYGAGPQPFTEASPLMPTTGKGRVRARMWHDALASGARVCEVRGSDYLGRGAASVFTLMALSGLRAGALVRLPADLDADHSWTFTGDVARTLVAASRSETSWRRAWHVPSTTRSIRGLAERLCEVGRLPAPRLARMTHSEFSALAAGDSILAAVTEMLYLFDGPAVMEASETTRALGVTVTPLDEVLADTLLG